MISQEVDSHIHFMHTSEEVAGLSQAIIPMAEYVAIVAKPDEKAKLKLIIRCKYFRVREARQVHAMLLRACKYARANLADYFPIMQEGILINSQKLENAANGYWAMFERLREETIPVH